MTALVCRVDRDDAGEREDVSHEGCGSRAMESLLTLVSSRAAPAAQDLRQGFYAVGHSNILVSLVGLYVRARGAWTVA